MAADRVDGAGSGRALGSVRVRTTLGAVLVVGVALVLAAVALVAILRGRLVDAVEVTASLRAREVAAVITESATPLSLAVDQDDEQLIQVIDADGVVLASSPNVRGRDVMADIRPGASTIVELELDEGRFVAVAAAADAGEGPLTVVVARNLDDIEDSVTTLTGLLGVGVPLLVLLVAVTTWLVVGRALAPVAAVRGVVEEISGTGLHRRVPQPSGDDEIAQLAATMNRMLVRLEAAAVRQRRFTSDASHELRSPVASIRQHAEVAIAHPDRTTVTRLAEVVLAEGLRVQGLVDDLLLLARADEGPRASAREVDLDDLVFAEAQLVRGTSTIFIDTAGVSAGRVSGEPGSLRRMVRNLLDNGVRHARTRVRVTLSEDAGGQVCLRVDDDGGGIPTADRVRVFERFVRLDDARDRDGGGAGLGLAIVAAVAAAHGGTVTAGPSPDGGARLEVRIPAG